MLDEAQMLQQLADALPFGVCIVDGRRNIRYWNSGAERITGHLRQDLVGRAGGDELLHWRGGENPLPRSCFGHLPLAETPSGGLRSFLLRHREGHCVPVLIRSLPLRQEDGVVVAHAEIFQPQQAAQEDLSWMGEADAHADPELGIPSAEATLDQLQLRVSEANASLAVFVIGVKDLARLMRTYGAPMGLAAQRSVVQSLTHLLTVPHFLGCWSQHRLLVMIADCSEFTFFRVQQQLAAIKTLELTWWGDRIPIASVSRGTLLHPGSATGDEVEAVLERLGAPGHTQDSIPAENL